MFTAHLNYNSVDPQSILLPIISTSAIAFPTWSVASRQSLSAIVGGNATGLYNLYNAYSYLSYRSRFLKFAFLLKVLQSPMLIRPMLVIGGR